MQRVAVAVFLLASAACVEAEINSCPAGTTCQCDDNPCDDFNCVDAYSCADAVLICDSTRCHMDCSGVGSCSESHLQCVGDYCQVRCAADESCQDMVTLEGSDIEGDSSLDSVGEDYGLWMGDKASEGKLICDGERSCYNASIGCGSDYCETVCNGVQSCSSSMFTITNTAESGLHRCTNQQSCKNSTFDFTYANGDVELRCENVESCEESLVHCPMSHDLTIHCGSRDACRSLTVERTSNDTRCTVECYDDACTDVSADDIQYPAETCVFYSAVAGAVNVTCQEVCVSTLDADVSTCSEWCTCSKYANDVEEVTKELLQLVSGAGATAGDFVTLIELLAELLSDFVSQMTLYWDCPASACPGNVCPVSALAKVAAGCIPEESQLTDATRRTARALQSSTASRVLLIGADYTNGGDASTAQEAIATEIESPTVTQGYDLVGVDVVSTSVLVSPDRAEEDDVQTVEVDDDDNSAKTGAIVGIVVAVVVVLIIIAIAVYFIMFRRAEEFRKESLSETRAPDSKL